MEFVLFIVAIILGLFFGEWLFNKIEEVEPIDEFDEMEEKF